VNNRAADAKVSKSIFICPLIMMKKPSTFLLLLATGTAFLADATVVKSKQSDLVEESTRRTKAMGTVEETANKGKVESIISKGIDAGATPAGRDLSDHGDGYNGANNGNYNGANNGDYNGANNGNYNGANNGNYDGANNDAYNGSNNNGAYNGNNNGAYNGNNNGAYHGNNNGAYNGNNGNINGYNNDAYSGNVDDAYNGKNGYNNGYNNDDQVFKGNPYGGSLYGTDAGCDLNDAYNNDSPYDISQYEQRTGPYSNGDGYPDMYDYDCLCPCEGSADVSYGVQVDIHDIFYGNPLPQVPCDLPVDTICVSDYRAIELIIDSPVIFQCRRFGYCLHYV
jgi:hypothetical protein